MPSEQHRAVTKEECPVCHRPVTKGRVAWHLKGETCWGPGVEWNAESHAAWRSKKNSSAPGVKMLLSGAEWFQLLEDAGITANDIGVDNQQYQLGRNNDTGHYEVGNCRFITALENRREMKPHKWCALITIDGMQYESFVSASKALLMGESTVRMRVNSKNFPEWKRIV